MYTHTAHSAIRNNQTDVSLVIIGADLAWTGEAVYSRYNPPFTPWFMRRNEIWLHLASKP
jgi:hypothetical protein